MAEYIEKQAAIDALHEAYEARNPTQNAIMDKATMVIFRLPPADVRPVVLCKDCDLWNKWDSSGRESLGTYRCSCAAWTAETTTFYTGPNEFCSRGERKCSDG